MNGQMRKGMEINPLISKMILIGQGMAKLIHKMCNDETLQKVNYQYQGTIFSSEKKVLNIIQKANSVFHFINSTLLGQLETKKETKISLFKTVFLSVLNDVESWTLLKYIYKVTVIKVTLLRNIKFSEKQEGVFKKTIG